MFSWVTSGVLAGMSATMCFWLIVGTIGMGVLTWKYRARFTMSKLHRGDAILNLGLCGYMAHGALHRGIATYGFATQTWSATASSPAVTTLNLIEAIASIACILWWMSIESAGVERNLAWWLLFIASGVMLGVGVAWRF